MTPEQTKQHRLLHAERQRFHVAKMTLEQGREYRAANARSHRKRIELMTSEQAEHHRLLNAERQRIHTKKKHKN